MASDEEIARQVRQREQGSRIGPDGTSTSEELKAYRQTASEVHDELARRVRNVEQEAASTDDLAAVVEKLEALEERLDGLEERL